MATCANPYHRLRLPRVSVPTAGAILINCDAFKRCLQGAQAPANAVDAGGALLVEYQLRTPVTLRASWIQRNCAPLPAGRTSNCATGSWIQCAMRCTSRVLGDVVICVSVPVSVPDVNRPDDLWSHQGPAFQKPVVAHQRHIAETNRELRRNLVFPKSHDCGTLARDPLGRYAISPHGSRASCIHRKFCRCSPGFRPPQLRLQLGCLAGMQGASAEATARIHGIGGRWRSWLAFCRKPVFNNFNLQAARMEPSRMGS